MTGIVASSDIVTPAQAGVHLLRHQERASRPGRGDGKQGETPSASFWARLGNVGWLPFADAATPDLPLGRLLRLSLFQLSCGMAAVLLTGTLNRVMIVELKIPAWAVALLVALPLVFAPLRALLGHKSDHHRSVLGWKRVPYIWFGSLLQFGGFAILPFALLIMSGDTTGPIWIGEVAAGLGFLLVGAGMHTVQTAGLALATDLAPEESRPSVVASLYVMLLAGMLVSSLVLGALLADFTALKLVKIVQGVAVAGLLLNMLALWKQEARNPAATAPERAVPDFAPTWAAFIATPRVRRLLVAIGIGSAAFAMQDVLLEPYGAEVLGLSVGATTALTALWAVGTLCGLALAAVQLGGGGEPHRLASLGLMIGIAAFAAVIFAAPLDAPALLLIGILGIGLGGGLFGVGTMTAAMALSTTAGAGLALGAWGAVQASCAGVAILIGGILRDIVAGLAASGSLGPALTDPAAAYGVVYHLEIGLLFAALIAIGPLVRRVPETNVVDAGAPPRFGLTQFPT